MEGCTHTPHARCTHVAAQGVLCFDIDVVLPQAATERIALALLLSAGTKGFGFVLFSFFFLLAAWLCCLYSNSVVRPASPHANGARDVGTTRGYCNTNIRVRRFARNVRLHKPWHKPIGQVFSRWCYQKYRDRSKTHPILMWRMKPSPTKRGIFGNPPPSPTPSLSSVATL